MTSTPCGRCRNANSARASPKSLSTGIIRRRGLFAQAWQTRTAQAAPARDPKALAGVVARCCQLKADWSSGQDETEGGLRAILNFGQTIGHALEAISGYGKWPLDAGANDGNG